MNLDNNKIFEINRYKIIVLIFLYLASYCALNIESAGLCVFDFYADQHVVYFNEMTGSAASDDGAMFGVAGILGILFSPMLVLKLNRSWLIGLLTTLITLQFFTICFVDIPVDQIIYDSVMYCHNYWIIGFLFFQLIFLILNILYIKFFIKNNE